MALWISIGAVVVVLLVIGSSSIAGTVEGVRTESGGCVFPVG